jgi:hypothetical protein
MQKVVRILTLRTMDSGLKLTVESLVVRILTGTDKEFKWTKVRMKKLR